MGCGPGGYRESDTMESDLVPAHGWYCGHDYQGMGFLISSVCGFLKLLELS